MTGKKPSYEISIDGTTGEMSITSSVIPIVEATPPEFADPLTGFRYELHQAGFKLRTVSYSDFIGGRIFTNKLDAEAEALPSIFFSEEERQRWLPAIEIVKKYKGRLFKGGKRIVV